MTIRRDITRRRNVPVARQLRYFSQGGITPGSFAALGLQFWVRGDLGVTKDGSDRVSVWADQSGKARNATQGTPEDQPLWVASSLNGQPGIRFSRANSEYLAIAHALVHGAASCSIFCALKLDNHQNVTRWFGNTGSGTTDYTGMTSEQVSAGFPDCGVAVSTFETVRGPSSWTGLSNGHVFDARMVGGGSQAWDNNSAGPANTNAFGSTIQCNSDKYIGTFENGGAPQAGVYYNGDILEIAVFAPALSAGDHLTLRTALMSRYGL